MVSSDEAVHSDTHSEHAMMPASEEPLGDAPSETAALLENKSTDGDKSLRMDRIAIIISVALAILIIVGLAAAVFAGAAVYLIATNLPHHEAPVHHPFTVKARRLYDHPIITSADSDWDFNYNAALYEMPDGTWALAVRTQNLNGQGTYGVGPSYVVHSKALSGGFSKWSHIDDNANIMLSPTSATYQALGCEDPRVWRHPKTKQYHMLYTAVHEASDGRPSDLGTVIARLAHATSTDGKIWDLHGEVWGDEAWSKSGALMLDEKTNKGYLLWGDKSICVATTDDFHTFTRTDVCPIATRENSFDSELVEAGPPPMKLSNGDWFFVYNSARAGFPSPKPGYALQYNLGWAVLDGKDPTKVKARAEEPILTPYYDWETADTPGNPGLTPNVVFVEGWRSAGTNSFEVIYQGADAAIGLMTINVEIN